MCFFLLFFLKYFYVLFYKMKYISILTLDFSIKVVANKYLNGTTDRQTYQLSLVTIAFFIFIITMLLQSILSLH